MDTHTHTPPTHLHMDTHSDACTHRCTRAWMHTHTHTQLHTHTHVAGSMGRLGVMVHTLPSAGDTHMCHRMLGPL